MELDNIPSIWQAITMVVNCLGFLPNVLGARMVYRGTDVNHAAFALIVQNMAFNFIARNDPLLMAHR